MSQDLKNKVIAYLQALEKTDWAAARHVRRDSHHLAQRRQGRRNT